MLCLSSGSEMRLVCLLKTARGFGGGGESLIFEDEYLDFGLSLAPTVAFGVASDGAAPTPLVGFNVVLLREVSVVTHLGWTFGLVVKM